MIFYNRYNVAVFLNVYNKKQIASYPFAICYNYIKFNKSDIIVLETKKPFGVKEILSL